MALIEDYQKSILRSKNKERISSMFDDISSKYDFLNHFLSFGFDRLWRKKAINLLKPFKPEAILDVATGTGDFAIEALSLNPKKITGIDISQKMIDIARLKTSQIVNSTSINFIPGDSESINEHDDSFDAVIVSFGVRNFENLSKGLSEMYRVLKPGGIVLILEFSIPEAIIIKQFYSIYFNFVLPKIGKLFSKHSYAYNYLPESVNRFPSGHNFTKVLEKAGFAGTRQVKLSFGIASIYSGFKK